ncbi:MAG TPA: hypothetical protein VGI76_09515 [Solirubrobacteraceae bacterium]
MRKLSKTLMGAQFRAEIAAFIAVGEPPFWARGMAYQLSLPENKVSAELSRFADEGLLRTISFAQWDRRKLYERGHSTHYWRFGYELLERAAAEEGLQHGIDSSTALKAYFDETGLPQDHERFEVE